MSTKTIIHTDKAPAAVGPYSQGVCINALQFISGQLPVDPATGKIVDGGIQAQTEQCLKNLGAVLEKAGVGYENVLKTTVLLADIADFAAMNEVYGRYFQEESPARMCFQVAALPMGALVEIDAITSRGYVKPEEV